MDKAAIEQLSLSERHLDNAKKSLEAGLNDVAAREIYRCAMQGVKAFLFSKDYEGPWDDNSVRMHFPRFALSSPNITDLDCRFLTLVAEINEFSLYSIRVQLPKDKVNDLIREANEFLHRLCEGICRNK